MLKPLLLAASLGLAALASAQPLVEENFAYPVGPLVPNGGWVAHSGAGANAVQVEATGLTFPNYPSTAGGAARVVSGATSREDVNRRFAPVTAGDLYVSALVNVTAVPAAAADFFLHLGVQVVGGATISTTDLRARVFIRADAAGTGYVFGFSKVAPVASATYEATSRVVGTTYLVVIKYTVVAGADNDTAALYVFAPGDDYSAEPATPTIVAADAATAASDFVPGAIALRQNGVSQNVLVDGFRVATTYAQAPLPVELAVFTGVADGTTARLAWTTLGETNNAGFAVEHERGGAWAEVGFETGRGTTTERATYAHAVANLTPGTHRFRLRQVDFDGASHTSAAVEIAVALDVPLALTVRGTAVRVAMREAGAVRVEAFDALGRRVAVLFDGALGAGEAREMSLDAGALARGVYVVRAVGAGDHVASRSVVVR